ncbi:MAG: hypothetical protein ACK5DE_04780 [Bacteroidota bacterium]
MATRNSVGRRLLSEAELEFANPFDEGTISNFEESFNSVPVVDNSTKQNLVNQLLANWQGLGTEVGIGSSGTENAEIGGRKLSVVADDFAQRLLDQGITDLSQAQFEPGKQAAWTAEGKGNVSLMSTQDGRLIPVWGSSSDASKARNIALTVGSMFVAPGLAGALGGGLGGFAGAGAILGGTKAAITGGDILQGAALGGLGGAAGYELGSLFGGSVPTTDAQFIAADAAQLAAQGIPAPQIEQVLQASGVNLGTAVAAADAAVSGMTVDQIAQDITLGNRGLFSDTTTTSTPTTVTTSPEGLQTVTTAAAAPVATLSDIVAAVPAAVLSQEGIRTADLPTLEATGLMASEAPQAVEVTGTAATPEAPTLQDIIVALTASLPPEAPQAVEVTGDKQQTQPDNVLAAVVPAVVPSAPVNETIEVTGTKSGVTSEDTGATIGAIPGVLEPGVGPQSGGGLETADQAARTEKQDTGLTLKDLYTALQALGALSSSGLFGGGGGGTQRPFVAPTATVPVGNDDYYRAVQQDYNTYMPAAPRDVATPLQQWYQGKFGG